MNYLKRELYNLIQSDNAIFDFLQDSSLDGLWYWDLENPEEEWMNRRFWETLGYNPDEMPHKAAAWQDIIHPDDLELATENAGKHFANPDFPYDQEVRYRHKNGSIVWIRCRGIAVRDENGAPKRMLGAHVDITQQKRIEDLLTKSNRIARVGAWEVDVENDKLFWSDVTKEIHEVPKDYLPDLATGINFYKEGFSRDKITEVVGEAIEKGKPWDVELQIITATGKEKWVRAIGHADFYNGACKWLYGVFQDIDEQKRAAIRLQKSEEQFRQIFTHAVTGIAMIGLKGEFIKVNQSFCNTFGYTEEELLKMNFQQLSHPATLQESLKYLRKLTSGEIPVYLTEREYLHRNGNYIWVQIAVSRVLDANHKVSHYVAQYLDITERKLAEERNRRLSILEAKSKEMEQFAYVASHDLREPLLTMLGFAQVIEEDHGDQLDEMGKSHLQVILQAADRMDKLIHGLLDYSRLSQVKQLQVVDVAEVLASVQTDLHASVQQNQAKIYVSDLPKVQGYPLELKMVFQNLVSNALKFKKNDVAPIIEISCEELLEGWQFSVGDNGIGIAASDLENIFLIFKRLHTKQRYPGTGIGLANCKKIIELHNGKIWATSTLGVGSTFHFTILTKNR